MTDHPLAILAEQNGWNRTSGSVSKDAASRPEVLGDKAIPIELPITPLPNWGVKNVAAALVQHEVGIFTLSGLLADQVSRNPRIKAALRTRVQAVTGLKRKFIPANKTARARKIAELAEENFAKWMPASESEALHQWMLLMGFGLAQCLYNTEKTPWMPEINLWHPANLYWYWDYDKLFGCWRLITANGILDPSRDERMIPGVDGQGEWVFPVSTKKRPWMEGLIRTLALSFVAWNQEFRTWARQAEKEGIAFLVATVPAAADANLVRALENQLRNIGSEPQATLKDGGEGNKWKIELIQPKSTSGYKTFQDFLERNDADIAIAINGQNLSQEVREKGARSATDSHLSVKWEYTVSDAVDLSTVWNDHILYPWAAHNFGAELAPRFQYVTEQSEDLKEKSQVFMNTANALKTFKDAGAPVDPLGIIRVMRIPEAQPGAPALLPPATGKPKPTSEEESQEDDKSDDGEPAARRQRRRGLAVASGAVAVHGSFRGAFKAAASGDLSSDEEEEADELDSLRVKAKLRTKTAVWPFLLAVRETIEEAIGYQDFFERLAHTFSVAGTTPPDRGQLYVDLAAIDDLHALLARAYAIGHAAGERVTETEKPHAHHDSELTSKRTQATVVFAELDAATSAWREAEKFQELGVALELAKEHIRGALDERWGATKDDGLDTAAITLAADMSVWSARQDGYYEAISTPEALENCPNWEYVCADAPCAICEPCDGVTLPADHVWWQTHTPLMHFRCMCQQLPTGENALITPDSELPTVQAEPGFGVPPGDIRWNMDTRPTALAEIARRRLRWN